VTLVVFERTMRGVRNGFLGMLFVGLTSCTGLPQGVEPVKDFEMERYLGQWYEIARLDHPFERGLSAVTASYSVRDDGGIKVVNRGFKDETDQWEQAEGKAYHVGSKEEGHLKVSFFGPFYGSYVIFELDTADYQYAFVAGMNTDYLWLLSRTPRISDELLAHFLEKAAGLGFDTNRLIMVDQTSRQ